MNLMVYSKNAHKKRIRRTSKAKETLDIVRSNMYRPNDSYSTPRRKDLRSNIEGEVTSKDLKALAKD